MNDDIDKIEGKISEEMDDRNFQDLYVGSRDDRNNDHGDIVMDTYSSENFNDQSEPCISQIVKGIPDFILVKDAPQSAENKILFSRGMAEILKGRNDDTRRSIHNNDMEGLQFGNADYDDDDDDLPVKVSILDDNQMLFDALKAIIMRNNRQDVGEKRWSEWSECKNGKQTKTCLKDCDPQVRVVERVC